MLFAAFTIIVGKTKKTKKIQKSTQPIMTYYLLLPYIYYEYEYSYYLLYKIKILRKYILVV